MATFIEYEDVTEAPHYHTENKYMHEKWQSNAAKPNINECSPLAYRSISHSEWNVPGNISLNNMPFIIALLSRWAAIFLQQLNMKLFYFIIDTATARMRASIRRPNRIGMSIACHHHCCKESSNAIIKYQPPSWRSLLKISWIIYRKNETSSRCELYYHATDYIVYSISSMSWDDNDDIDRNYETLLSMPRYGDHDWPYCSIFLPRMIWAIMQ